MKATVDKPWVAVGPVSGHVWARAANTVDLIKFVRAAHREGWPAMLIEHRLPTFGEAMAHYMRPRRDGIREPLAAPAGCPVHGYSPHHGCRVCEARVMSA